MFLKMTEINLNRCDLNEYTKMNSFWTLIKANFWKDLDLNIKFNFASILIMNAKYDLLFHLLLDLLSHEQLTIIIRNKIFDVFIKSYYFFY